ncbi:hypothetical protein [Streptomyces sp. NPDC017673]|uniref:hypothetical protein n=1 Tax=unclassified Streptomyces TaxID=2593676 RepID=UPI0037B6D1F4
MEGERGRTPHHVLGARAGDTEDIGYTQTFLPGLKNFYRTAARNGRAAIFTVDQ